MKIQIDDTIQDATPAQVEVIEARRADVEAQEAADKARVAAFQSARKKLTALGLSEAEVAAIVGG